MSQYFCPECGYEGDEPICPHCNIPAESLEFKDEEILNNSQTYPEEILEKTTLEKEEDILFPPSEDDNYKDNKEIQ